MRRCAILVAMAVLMGWIPAASAQEDAPAQRPLTLGVHLPVWLYAEYDFAKDDWPELDDPRRTILRNLDWISKRGYGVLLADVMDAEDGQYFFESPLLKRKRYKEGPAFAKLLVAEARKRGMKIFGEHTILAWRLDEHQTRQYGIGGIPLTVDEVKDVTRTLLLDCGFDGIVEETYPPKYVAGIYEATQEVGKTYIHKFDDEAGNADILMSEDYAGHYSSARHAKSVSKTGAEANNLGWFNMMFAHARALGKPAWVKVCGQFDLPNGASRNVFLMRAVQFQCDGYFWMPASEECVKWLGRMDRAKLDDELNRFRAPVARKRTANLVMAFAQANEWKEEQYAFTVHALGAATTGAMFAGYDLRASYGKPLADADAYIVMAIGDTELVRGNVRDEIVALLSGDAPVVFVVNGLTRRGPWAKVLAHFGLDIDGDALDRRIDTVRFADHNVRWSPWTIWDFPTRTARIRLTGDSARAAVTGKVGGRRIPLVVTAGNKALVNANALHIDAAFIVNHLLDGALREPFTGFGCVGERSAFLAMEDTRISVELPFDDGASIRVIGYSARGEKTGERTQPYAAPFERGMKRYELVIVERAAK